MRAPALTQAIARNAGFVYFSFIATAYVMVAPQIVFARAAPAHKSMWLSATLLTGTTACLAALELARRYGYGQRPLAWGSALVLGLAGLLVLAPGLPHPLSFAAACVALRAIAQYGTQENDRRAVLLAGPAGRAANDGVGLLLRFTGMLLGTLWFGLHPALDSATLAVFALTGTMALVSTVTLAAPTADSVGGPPPPVEAPDAGRIAGGDRGIVWASRFIYACFYLLGANLVYALRDLHGLADATRRGGVLITLSYGSAVVFTPLLAALGLARRRSLYPMLAAPAAMFAVGLLLPTASARSFVAAAVAAAIIGAAFAAFQLALRGYTSYLALHRGQMRLLAVFNNLANTSGLLAFAAMLGLTASARLLGVEAAAACSFGVSAFGLAALPLALAGARFAAAARE